MCNEKATARNFLQAVALGIHNQTVLTLKTFYKIHCSGRAKIATLRSERNDQSGQGEIANSPVGDFLV